MPKLITEGDVAYFSKINKEMYTLLFKKVKILYKKRHKHDEIYGEDLNMLFSKPFEIEGYIPSLAEYKAYSTRFGLDERRDLVIIFSKDLFLDSTKPLPQIGDRVEVQNDLFEIRQTNPGDYGSNLQLPLSHFCILHRVRPEEPEQGTTNYVGY